MSNTGPILNGNKLFYGLLLLALTGGGSFVTHRAVAAYEKATGNAIKLGTIEDDVKEIKCDVKELLQHAARSKP